MVLKNLRTFLKGKAMTKTPEELTADWKAGELESLGELVKQIEEVDNRRALSDEYLIERNEAPRSEYAPAEEWGYGIVWAMSDYVLPYLKELQTIKEENARLKELLKECQTIISNNLYEFDSDDCSRSCNLIKEIEEALR